MRFTVLLLWLLLLCLACNQQHDTTAPAAAAPATPNAVHSQPATPDTVAANDKPSPLPAAKAKAFVAYQEKLIPMTAEFVKGRDEFNKNAAAGKYQGAVGSVRGYKDLHDKLGATANELEAARTGSGLSEDDVSALTEIEERVLTRVSTAASRIDEQMASMKKAIASMPEAERGGAQTSLDELKQVQANVVGMKEMRDKYGDAIVDAMIAQEAEFTRQTKALSKAR